MKMISSAARVFHAFARALSLAALFTLLLIGSMSAAARVTTELAPAGISDSVRYESGRNEIEVRGWAWDPISKHAARAIELKVNGVPVATQTLRTVERPDVAVRFPDATSVHVGFIVTATPTTKVSAGWHRVEVKAIFPDDRALALVDWNGGTPQMHAQVTPARHWILLFLVLAGFAAAYARRTRALATRCGAWVERHHRGVLLGIGGAFVTLVALGVNGSSMELLERTPLGKSVMETEGVDGRLFKLRPVRGDEWAILMPNVLAQLSHEPRFPIVNRNLGLEGQNMGVVGMTGVPIAQPAAVARPATWGYFFLPLRQAISWHWNFPFFACLVGVWLLLNAFGPASKGFNLALAASFTLAPYAAAWSNWPLHAVAFPVGLLITLFALLRATSAPMAALLGAALGWLLAAWTLVLYPPWQASIGTLSLLIVVGYVLDRRRDCQAGVPQALGVLVSIVVVGLILGSWWSDTREAIAQVSATVYPGQRSTLQGGDGGFFWFLRGFTNAETISFGTGPWSNESEISAYFLLPWVLLWLAVWHGLRHHAQRWTIGACLLFVVFWLCYYFIGFPVWLSKLTLWGRVPFGRADLSLGLACTLMLALVLSGPTGAQTKMTANAGMRLTPLPVAGLIALASGALVAYGLVYMPREVFSRNSLVYQAAITLSAVAMTWWMLRGRAAASVGLLLLLCLVSVAGFNPIAIAPSSVGLSSPAKAFSQADPNEPSKAARTLFVGAGVSALQLGALGVPIVNGILYYPHRTLWKSRGLSEAEWSTVNRYQHLNFVLANLPTGPTYVVKAPLMDQVSVAVDPRRFDFSLTGAEQVVAVLDDGGRSLYDNSGLTEIGTHEGVVWFKVRRQQP